MNKRRTGLQVILVIVMLAAARFFILPRFDFMYIPADKYWIREKTKKQGNKEIQSLKEVGNKIFSSSPKYNGISRDRVFDDYVVYKTSHGLENRIGLRIPRYYIFDSNILKYRTNIFRVFRYYQEPAVWDSYHKEDVLPMDSFAREIDQQVRAREENRLEDRDLTNYALKSIELRINNFSEVMDGYIYIFAAQLVIYRDKDYGRKAVPTKEGVFKEEEIKKVEYIAGNGSIFRIKVEDLKNASDDSLIDYEQVNEYFDWGGELEDFAITDDTIYSLREAWSCDEDGFKNIYVYATDIGTGVSKEIYKKKAFFQDTVFFKIYCTNQHLFIYEDGRGDNKYTLTRVGRDGSYPVLMINESGEVVIEPLETVQ